MPWSKNDELTTATPSSPYVAYLAESTLPLNALIFLSPVLIIYHLGIWFMSAMDLRVANGADVMLAKMLNWLYLGGVKIIDWWSGASHDGWLRWFLQTFSSGFALFLLVVCLLVQQNFANRRWRFKPRLFLFMTIESILFALPIFFLDWGVQYAQLNAVVNGEINGWLAGLVLSMGAGVYEEFLFRWLLMSALFYGLGTLIKIPHHRVYYVAMILQALAFSGFHYLPWSHEVFTFPVFIFRVLAGLYFGYLFQERKFAIVAGSHIMYDIFVVSVRYCCA